MRSQGHWKNKDSQVFYLLKAIFPPLTFLWTLVRTGVLYLGSILFLRNILLIFMTRLHYCSETLFLVLNQGFQIWFLCFLLNLNFIIHNIIYYLIWFSHFKMESYIKIVYCILQICIWFVYYKPLKAIISLIKVI